MALDHSGVTLAALNHVGVDRPLGQSMDLAQVLCLLLKHPDEFFSDDFPFSLRVPDAGQLLQKTFPGVHPDQPDAEAVLEGLFHKISLALPQQTVVHKDADQVLPDGPVQQQGRHRGVHTARQSQQNPLPREPGPVIGNDPICVIQRAPITLAAADGKEKIPKNLSAIFGVGHLRMKLYAIELLRVAAQGGAGAFFRVCKDLPALRQSADVVRMAHPTGA